MAGRLAGKVALITGTGGGQGRAGAIRFAAEGAKVVGCDLKVDGARETLDLVQGAGGEMVSAAPLDLADEDAVRGLMEFAVDAFGDFDILWNNAGSGRFGLLESQSIEDFAYTLTHEVSIVFMAIKHAIPIFARKGRGVILNTASVSGAGVGSGCVGNVAGMLSHAVAKAGVVRMSSSLAVELSPRNIRVNSISPGIIETPATLPLTGTTQVPGPLRDAFLDQLLIRRIGHPDDVANAALYLVSDEADYVTGVNLTVDGGFTASGGVGQPSGAVARMRDTALAAYSF